MRHIPAGSRFDVLDFRFAGKGAGNRWNSQGQPTLYLASDEGVLIAEWGRHFEVNRTPELRSQTVERIVYRLAINLEHVLDLRQAAVCNDLSLENAPICFFDPVIARATANYIRATTDARAIVVPSVSFLDQTDRWCLVLFLEKLPQSRDYIINVTPGGTLRLG